MSNLYELHITVDKKDAAKATEVARQLHWKTSQIDGDPVLGAKPFFYLTTYVRASTLSVSPARQRLRQGVHGLRNAGVYVLREKIELIIYDARHPTAEP